MEKDLIQILEEKVSGVIQRLNELNEENQSLKNSASQLREELNSALKRIEELEAQRDAALRKVESIIEKIDLLQLKGSAPENPTQNSEAEFQGESDEIAPGVKTLF